MYQDLPSGGGADYKPLFFASIFGTKQQVKTVIANIVTQKENMFLYKGSDPTAVNDGAYYWCGDYNTKWKFVTKSLPGEGYSHAILYDTRFIYDSTEEEFMIAVPKYTDVSRIYFQYMNKRCTIPMMPAWANWLWERALNKNIVTKMISNNLYAYRHEGKDHALEEDIKRALSYRRLSTE